MNMKRRRATSQVIKTVRTEITVESAEFRILAPSGDTAEIWCSLCGERVRGWKPETAASLIGARTRVIYQCLEAGTLHFAENPDGTIWVCHNSLFRPDLLTG